MPAHKYTDEQMEWLAKNRPTMTERQTGEAFNLKFDTHISYKAISQICRKRGIKSAIANSGQFKSGDISWNKGAIGVRVSPATEFKKGNAPHNVLPIGTELMKDDDYLWVKVADPNVWRQKHRIVWESIHGAQPKGTAIVFLDGDRLNFDPDNLQLLTRRELLQMNRNKYSQAPAELKPSVLAVSRLQSAIYTRSREE